MKGKNNMKKVVAFVFLLTLSGCTQTNSKEFKEIVDVKSLSKIEVIDGRNGKRYSLKEDKQQFVDLLTERIYKKMKHHEKTKGYIYHANLFSDEKEFSITFLDDGIEINDIYYSLNKPITENEISDLLE